MKSKLLLITANLLMLLSISWSGGRIPSKHTGISSWWQPAALPQRVSRLILRYTAASL
jgi:hypothetical protein